MTQQKKYSLYNEFSLGSMIAGIKYLISIAIKYWRVLILLPILFAIVGLFLGMMLGEDKKKAEFIIAAEEEGPSGMENLLAQFGMDVGGSNPGGVFEGESLVKLFHLRSLVERTLCKSFMHNGKSQVLADAIYPYVKDFKNPVFKGVKFHSNRAENNRITDSALYILYRYVGAEMLTVSRPDKKQSFVTVGCLHADPEIAVALSENIIHTVTDYYVETLTKKARHNLNVLKQESDSIQQVLNKNLQLNALNSDLNLNPMMQKARVSQNRSLIDLQISISLYGEVIKNLKLAEIGLRKQTPLIQVIDSPHYPLETVGMNLWEFMLGGFVLGLLVAIYIIHKGENNPSTKNEIA